MPYSRNGIDVDMKLGLVSKLYEKKFIDVKKNDKDVILTKYDALVIFLIQGWVGLIWKQFQMHGLLFLSFNQ